MDNLNLDFDQAQKAQLHEVADLLLEIYRTLARMRYLDLEWIQQGPHDIQNILPACRELKLDPSIIYLYSILPYINPKFADTVDFFHGSYFVDYRDEVHVKFYGRDPFFADDEEYSMRAWMTPLSRLGNHQSVILYSAKSHRIWIVDQEYMDATDHALRLGLGLEDEDYHSVSDSDSGSDSDSEIVVMTPAESDQEEKRSVKKRSVSPQVWEKETRAECEAETSNGHIAKDPTEVAGYYSLMPGRPAGEVLRDINRWYLELKETPGGGENTGGDWKRNVVKPLYLKHGWPGDNFDGDAFLRDSLRAHAARFAKWRAKQRFKKKQNYADLSDNDDAPVQQKKRERLANATTVDDEWLTHWELWETERAYIRSREYKIEEKAAARRLFPGERCRRSEDKPLWEVEQMRQRAAEKQGDVERIR
ncbi:hypothetical protein AJ79_09846 [Helicocarpus griseus UAMH5409]|uniref:Uncharacterized protein n=1 Tax=Helicocarpus griseus UAMH5409 TaxID=1447875 RepID=A0A2B7WH32_9EURO|nr:hypothetical protein AJ79_09846 [Helicocarpus griseus UAMH5409]